MDSLRQWPCASRAFVVAPERVACFGKFESECAAAAILKVFEATNRWGPFQLDDLRRVGHGDIMTLSGVDYLLRGKYLVEVGDRYMVSEAFVERLFNG